MKDREENLYTPDCIRTFTGIYMNVFDPTPEMICIEDIAHSLSMQPRFAGHLPEFYSVAQHCVECTLISAPEYKLSALLHDASEAYLLDIPSPIKKRLSGYKDIEDRLMGVIASKFGFKYPLENPVKEADRVMLEFEWDFLMLKKPKTSPIVCWSVEYAKARFLYEYYAITKGNASNPDSLSPMRFA